MSEQEQEGISPAAHAAGDVTAAVAALLHDDPEEYRAIASHWNPQLAARTACTWLTAMTVIVARDEGDDPEVAWQRLSAVMRPLPSGVSDDPR
jgi:hypothetical protein